MSFLPQHPGPHNPALPFPGGHLGSEGIPCWIPFICSCTAISNFSLLREQAMLIPAFPHISAAQLKTSCFQAAWQDLSITCCSSWDTRAVSKDYFSRESSALHFPLSLNHQSQVLLPPPSSPRSAGSPISSVATLMLG